jgi:hypothetical protein
VGQFEFKLAHYLPMRGVDAATSAFRDRYGFPPLISSLRTR